ncbi:MAG: MtrAB system histidine kinase MtrB [Actinomycetes bacterium]
MKPAAERSAGKAGVEVPRAGTSGLLGPWRRSLQLRVVATTLLVSLVILTSLGFMLLNRVSDGLVTAKVRVSLVEAAAGQVEAQRILDAAGASTTPLSPQSLVDQVVTVLLSRSGSPPLFEVLLLSALPTGSVAPERGSYLVSEVSLPADLRSSVRHGQNQQYTFTTIKYLDGTAAPGLAVGAPLTVRSIGPYELYYLFPLTQEQETLDLVRRTVLGTGALLLAAVGLLAGYVTRQVVRPVRQAAETAERLSSGQLGERMRPHGDDELARLGRSFNDMAESLQRQIGQLEELSRVQQQFVADVSHELRTPLTTVRMAADVLFESRSSFDAGTARAAELLQTQLDRFEAMLGDLLEISRFDAGVAVLDLEPVDLRLVASRVVERTLPLAQRHRSMVIVASAPSQCIVMADPRRVERILRNLVVNAIEHGEGHPVRIWFGADADAVAVGVRDYGAGLHEAESGLVFNRFWRGDPARARTTGGTGLGLSISREDAGLHGGWLQAWGAPGRGSHFRLTLPRDRTVVLKSSPLSLRPPDASAAIPATANVEAGVADAN